MSSEKISFLYTSWEFYRRECSSRFPLQTACSITQVRSDLSLSWRPVYLSLRSRPVWYFCLSRVFPRTYQQRQPPTAQWGREGVEINSIIRDNVDSSRSRAKRTTSTFLRDFIILTRCFYSTSERMDRKTCITRREIDFVRQRRFNFGKTFWTVHRLIILLIFYRKDLLRVINAIIKTDTLEQWCIVYYNNTSNYFVV